MINKVKIFRTKQLIKYNLNSLANKEEEVRAKVREELYTSINLALNPNMVKIYNDLLEYFNKRCAYYGKVG